MFSDSAPCLYFLFLEFYVVKFNNNSAGVSNETENKYELLFKTRYLVSRPEFFTTKTS